MTTWADIHSAQFRYTAKRWGVNWESNADGDPFLDPAEYSTWVLPKYYAEEVARFWDRALAEWDRDQYDYLGTHLEAAIDKYRIARTTALEGPTELDPAIPGEPVIVPRNAGPFWAASGELAVWLDATERAPTDSDIWREAVVGGTREWSAWVADLAPGAARRVAGAAGDIIDRLFKSALPVALLAIAAAVVLKREGVI